MSSTAPAVTSTTDRISDLISPASLQSTPPANRPRLVLHNAANSSTESIAAEAQGASLSIFSQPSSRKADLLRFLDREPSIRSQRPPSYRTTASANQRSQNGNETRHVHPRPQPPLPPSYPDRACEAGPSRLPDPQAQRNSDYQTRENSRRESRGAIFRVVSLGRQTEHQISGEHETSSTSGVILRLKSFASSGTTTPVFLQGYDINGSVSVPAEMLEKNDFKQISLKITGTLRRTFREQATFLDESTLIWTPKDDHNALQNLPFSVPLPTNGRNKEYQSSPFPLPNSFSGDQLTVTYALSLVISRGVLRPAVTLRSSFNYVQMPMPHPPSPLMLRAYTERTPLSGPAVDGDGWFKSPVSEVSATLYSEPPRTLETTLYLALPRMYSRTSYIPIRLMLKCSDSHVLDLFSKPGIPRLCLVRRESIRLNRGIIKSDEKTSDIRLVGVAKTWLAPKPENDKDDVVMFCAEIPLNPNLIPNFAVGELSVKYYVVLLPWLAPGLSTSAAPNVALIQQEVDIIATPLSPSPVSSAPPQAIVHDITLDRWAAMAKRKGNETFFDMRHLSFGR